MTAERHKRVEAIFLALAEIPREQWDHELAQRCGGDKDIESEVRSLLGFHARADQFLDDREIKVHGMALDPGPDDVLKPGTRVGEYSIVSLVGTGGMGHVYVAEQDRPRRTVAIKVIRRSMISHSLFRRFEHEAEVLGKLQHPGIAQIYEAGVAAIGTDLPQPFIAMELVKGKSLTAHCDEHGLASRARLELIAKVCDAVHHAHQRGVIHRDLKPANILVDDQHQPKVLDFGVARAADADLRVTTLQTSVGQLIGTLPYMSPEQVIGDPAELDTRSDVYALGVVLYELLTGRLPYDFKSRALPEAARLIRDEPPARLSTIDRTLRGDVDTIVNKALAKDKSRRYQSAAELATDIRAFLEGRPISARQDSALYLFRTQVRRHKGAVAAAIAALAGIIAFAVFASLQSRANARLANAARAELASSNIERARSLGMAGNIAAAEDLLWPEHLRHPDNRRTFFALWELYSRERCEATISIEGRPRALHMRLSPDGRLLALTGGSSPVVVYDTQSCKQLCAFGIDPSQPPAAPAEDQSTPATGVRQSTGPGLAMAFARNGDLYTGDSLGRVRRWNARTGEDLGLVYQTGEGRGAPAITELACSPFDGSIAVLLRGGSLRLLAEPRGELGAGGARCRAIWSLVDKSRRRPRITSAAFSPAGDQLAIGCTDRVIRILDAATLEGMFEIPIDRRFETVPLAYSPSGRMLSAARESRFMRIWDTSNCRLLHSLSASNGGLRGVAFTPDDSRVLAIGWWYLQVWDLATETIVQTSAIRAGGGDLAVSADGRLAYGDLGDTVRVWELDPFAGRTVLDGQAERRVNAAMVPDGTIIAGYPDGNVRLLAPDGSAIMLLGTGAGYVRGFSFSPTAPIVAALDAAGMLQLFDWKRRVKIHELTGFGLPVYDGFHFDSTGSRMVLPGAKGTFHVLSMPDGKKLLSLPENPGEALAAAFSPDDRRIVVSRRQSPPAIFDAATGERLVECENMSSTTWCVTFSPDGSKVLSGTWGRAIDVWDARTGKFLRRLSGHRGLVMSMSFRPGEPTILATSAGDGQVMLWDLSLDIDTPVLTLGGFDNWDLWGMSFDSTGQRLIGTNGLGLSVIWDLRHFNRHIGGNMQFQISRHRAALGDSFDEAAAMRQLPLLLNRGRPESAGDSAAAGTSPVHSSR